MEPAVRRSLCALRLGRGGWSLAFLCLAATAVGAPGREQDQGAGQAWLSLAVPGGTAALLEAAGLEPTRPRTTALRDIIRVIYDAPPGTEAEVDERRARVVSHLKAVEAQQRPDEVANRPLPADSVPLPLPEKAWRALTRRAGDPPGTLVRAILADRSAALLYYGLCSVDEDTRRYLAARPDLLERLSAPDRAPFAALFARALHVRENRIDPAGGPEAAAVWEAVVGEPVAQPDVFIPAVLGKGGGRLALLYDAVAHMDRARQRFVLGLWIDDPRRRVDRFKAVYSACARGLSGWRPHLRPFARILYDPAHLLLNARVSPDGRPGPLGRRSFWERALGDGPFARLDETTANAIGRGFGPVSGAGGVEQGDVLDAAALLEVIYERRPAFPRDVAEAWCFGERVFGAASPASVPDVLVAVRGHFRYRSLVLTLERLGISDPALYAAAIDRAERIVRIDDRERVSTALSLYQGALALIERGRLARTFDVPAASGLIDSLAHLPISPGGEDLGAVASWVDTRFLPALGAPATADLDASSPAELRVLGAFAGRAQDRVTPAATVAYEGTRYRLDPYGARLATIRAVRARQRGPSLDDALAFSREVRALVLRADSRDDAAGHLARLAQVAANVLAASRDVPAWKGGETRRGWMAEAARDIEDLRKGAGPRSLEGRVARLSRAADRLVGQVLVSLAYAGALPNPNSPALMAGDPSLAHDWGIGYGDRWVPAAFTWALPSDSHDNGRWRVRGGVLGLDLCLGTEALRRLSSDSLAGPPTISDDDGRAFIEAALLANAADYRDEDMRLLSAAIWRGRLRVAALALDPSALGRLAAAADLDETRRELLSWAVVHEPQRLAEFFALAECLRLGAEDGEPLPRALEAWGASGLSYDGRLALWFPPTQPFATLAGRRTRGLLGALLPDLALLVAEMLDEHRLPAALVRPVLLVATRDYLDRLNLAYRDDWITLVAGVQRIVPARMDDYLASVTTAGPLVVLPAGMEDKRP